MQRRRQVDERTPATHILSHENKFASPCTTSHTIYNRYDENSLPITWRNVHVSRWCVCTSMFAYYICVAHFLTVDFLTKRTCKREYLIATGSGYRYGFAGSFKGAI